MGLAFEKPDHSRERAKAASEKKQAWLDVVRIVRKRDGYICRACGCKADDQNPIDPHHIKFRSAGGKDTPQNVALLCRHCHNDIHGYRLAAIGDNANKPLKFVRRDA